MRQEFERAYRSEYGQYMSKVEREKKLKQQRRSFNVLSSAVSVLFSSILFTDMINYNSLNCNSQQDLAVCKRTLMRGSKQS